MKKVRIHDEIQEKSKIEHLQYLMNLVENFIETQSLQDTGFF